MAMSTVEPRILMELPGPIAAEVIASVRELLTDLRAFFHALP